MMMSLRKSLSETSRPKPEPKFQTLLAHFSNSVSCVTPRSSVTASYFVRPGDFRDVDGSRIAHHLAHPRPDHHDVRPSLHPMLVRFPLMWVVVGGAGIPGQHVDETDLVQRLLARADQLEPFQPVLVGA